MIYTCRTCGRTSAETFFRPMCRRLCAACKDEAKAARAARVAAGAKPRGIRKKRSRTGSREHSTPHLEWIRSLPCMIGRPTCGTTVHAHHVRVGTGGGTGRKPDDRWTVPLCPLHHAEGHTGGWATFEAKHGVDLRARAIELAACSPALLAEFA